jgi:hypothetical protein
MGATVFKQGDVWWKQSRRFTYRPLLPFKKYDVSTVVGPTRRLGIYQHAVKDGQSHNSYLNLIEYGDIQDYSLNKLHKGPRRNLQYALNSNLTVRKLTDEGEFCTKAHQVYLSFYRRSGYGVNRSRVYKSGFASWAHSLFEFPEVVVIGAFRGDDLLSFDISCLVENTVILMARVHSDQGLRVRTPDLLLHTWRAKAREQSGVQMILDSMLANDVGLNEFKIRRGARVLAVPAFIHLNPILLSLVRKGGRKLRKRALGLNPSELAEVSHSRLLNLSK